MGKYWMKCGNCGAINRVAADKIGGEGKCGKCNETFRADTCVPIKVTDATWQSEVKDDDGLAVVEVWTATCPACKQYEAQVRQMAQSLCGKARVLQINGGENPRTASTYQVSALPSLLFFKGGKLVKALQGGQSEAVVRQALGV